MNDVLQLVRENIRNLEPYSTARDEYAGGSIGVFLDANENPYENGLNRYPDPHQRLLKQRISEIKHVPVDHIFIGNGSDEAIDILYRVFCVPGQDNAVVISPSYGMYKVAAATNDVAVREVPLTTEFGLPCDALLAATDSHTKLMMVCSPNNPSGNAFAMADMEWLLTHFHGVLVVDEAYIDFSSLPSMTGLLGRYTNLVVLQTLSKAWGLAGLRVGLAFAAPSLIELFSRVKYPYNINVLAQQTALKMLDVERQAQQVQLIVTERARVARELAHCRRVLRIYPSEANFLLVQVDDANQLYDELIAQRVIVRNRSRVRGCAGCLRITIGTPEENDRMLNVMNKDA